MILGPGWNPVGAAAASAGPDPPQAATPAPVSSTTASLEASRRRVVPSLCGARAMRIGSVQQLVQETRIPSHVTGPEVRFVYVDRIAGRVRYAAAGRVAHPVEGFDHARAGGDGRGADRVTGRRDTRLQLCA